jgi:hypothetical protein
MDVWLVEPVHVWTDVHVRLLRLLPLLLTATTLATALACSDAKPRPQVVEQDASDAADAGPVSIIDAGPDASCALPVSFGSSSCNACVAETCCNVLGACEADEQCKARTACWVACFGEPDAGGCTSVCEAKHPDDKSLWYDLWGCVYFNPPCETHCAVTR